VSIVLFAFDPNFIAHSGLVTTDVGVSLFIFATVYFFWRWTRSASPVDAVLFIVSCALAVLAKFSAVLLVPILLVLAFHAWRPRRTRVLLLGATCLVVAVLAVWAAYRFRWSAAVDPEGAARDEDAARATLSQPRLDAMPAWPRGHFPLRDVVEEWSAKRVVLARGEPIAADTIASVRKSTRVGATQRAILFAAEHRLLPEAYLFGVAWVGSTSMNRASYLNGEFSDTGFRTFFFWTTLYKLPIGALIAMILGVVFAVRARVTPFVIWPVAIYLAFTLASNLNIGHRHILPIFPFLYVACGALAGWKRKWITAALLAAAIVSTSLAWSRHLSYINILGTRDKLTDSNFDWGQDLKRLPAATREPVHLVYFGTARPAWYGIPTSDSSPLLAISQAHELGAFAPPAQRTYWRDYLAAHHARRVGAAGDTITIYKLE
jgi:4-amino-4-deoxy-L-arabinose transferase-like glycosyltransferase